ncbi:MAG: iron ABC transporter permease [Deltaproteobacteria bacterium]|nr:iron ABC transporter permease [Deltaproteobacteria bacterium]
MHFADGTLHPEYCRYISRKTTFLVLGLLVLIAAILYGISCGAARIPVEEVVRALAGIGESKRVHIIIWQIRLPQVLAAVVAGAGLSVSGAVMQSILRNPLGSPFTLGISHAAAFGAAFSVMILGSGTMSSNNVGAVAISNPVVTMAAAFVFSMLASFFIVAVARMRGATPETMILAGVALGALFTAGTMFLQFFADDVQLAAMVFWTFGDVARACWKELAVIAGVTAAGLLYFFFNAWNYNAVDAGDETAKGLGVKVERVRMAGMLAASLVTAVLVSFLGIIGFMGLVCPHMVRRLIGGDNRFLLPASAVLGAVLLLLSDTAARLILAPHLLPVSILTAFMGAPVFLLLIVKGRVR